MIQIIDKNGNISETDAALLTELKLKADLTETQPVSVAVLPLPTGSSTSALQTTGNSILSTIDGKIPSGLTVTSSRLQVELPPGGSGLTDAELRASAIDVNVVAMSGGGLTDIELRATPVPISGTVTATPTGTQNVDITANTVGISTSAKQDLLLAELQLKADLTETQPVSLASVPLPTGAATAALQTTGNTSLGNIDTKLPSGLTVTSSRLQVELPPGGTGLTDTELRATPVPISGTVTVNAGTDLNTSALALETTLQSVKTAVEIIDNAISGTEMQVDVLTMPSVTVTATDLDIRDLTFATDKVDVSGSTGVGVTGTFWQATQPVSAASLPLPTGAATSALQTQPGVDIGDVTINNAAGASAVNIQDGGNTITVDGTVTANLAAGTNNIGDVDVLTLPSIPAGTNNIGDVDIITMPNIVIGSGTVTTVSTVTNLSQLGGTAISMNTGVRDAGTQRVTIATNDAVPVTDNGSSLTVDAPVGTPVYVRLSDGAAAITTLPVSIATAPVLVAGSAIIGKVGIDQTTPGTTNAVQDIPATSGGLSKFHLVGAASTNATNIKASAGQVYTITAFNLNASPRYLKFHNTAGTPTAGSGVTDTYLIPGNASGTGLVLNIDKGIVFGTGIGITITTGIADADTGAISASEVVVNIYYK